MLPFTRLTEGFDPIGGGAGRDPLPTPPPGGLGGAMRWLLVAAALVFLASVTVMPLFAPGPPEPAAGAGVAAGR